MTKNILKFVFLSIFLLPNLGFATNIEEEIGEFRPFIYKMELEGTEEFITYRHTYFLPHHKDYFNTYNLTTYEIDKINDIMWNSQPPTLKQILDRLNSLIAADQKRQRVHSNLLVLYKDFKRFSTSDIIFDREEKKEKEESEVKCRECSSLREEIEQIRRERDTLLDLPKKNSWSKGFVTGLVVGGITMLGVFFFIKWKKK